MTRTQHSKINLSLNKLPATLLGIDTLSQQLHQTWLARYSSPNTLTPNAQVGVVHDFGIQAKGIVMSNGGMDRRDFHKLAAAALGGMVAGTTIGCRGSASAPAPTTTAATDPPGPVTLTDQEQLILDEPHTCRGLNSCKGNGRGKDNACAGQGTCATMADHPCGSNNKCKGQGGCGELPGMNACEGKGGCHIPLMDDAWTTARSAFEAAMKKSGNAFGKAPAKAKG